MANKKRAKSLLSAEAKAAIRAAKWQQKQAEKLYKDKIKEMRPYLKSLKLIDLRKPLKPSQKSFITRAYKDYTEITTRPTKIFRTKNKKKLKMVQAASQQNTKVKFDVAFIPTMPGTKVRVTKDKLVISSKWVDETKILYDMKKLAMDPAKEIERVVKANKDMTAFVMMSGAYIFNGTIENDLELVISEVMGHYAKYDFGGAKYNGKNHFTDWAFGLRGYKAKDGKMKSVSNYVGDYKAEVLKIRAAKKSQRRKRVRDYGKK